MMVGLLPVTAGEIELDGCSVSKLLNEDRRALYRRVQMVFQDPLGSLNPRKTVRQILEAPLKALQVMSHNDRRDRVRELMALVRLRAEFADRHPHEFSGGQCQRIGIARALAAGPELIILDEPVSALDVSVQAQILALLADLQARLNLTYVFISHDLAVVETISSEVAVMQCGKIVERGSRAEIFANPRHEYTRLLLSSIPICGERAPRAGQRALAHGRAVVSRGAAQSDRSGRLCRGRGLQSVRGDGVVALGGGSPIDLAKGVALLATHPGPLEQYAAILGGVARITGNGRAGHRHPDHGRHRRRGRPGGAADPRRRAQARLHQPAPHPEARDLRPGADARPAARLTAATGLDALSHCIETFLSPRFNPPAEAIALDGARRLWRWLERAVAEGSDLEAPGEMMMGALEGGLSFQKGLGAVHALSHALGGLPDLKLHHGTLNAILMPPVIRFNADHVGDKLARLNTAMGLAFATDLAVESRRSTGVSIPARLGALGVTRASPDGDRARARRSQPPDQPARRDGRGLCGDIG